MPAGTADAIRAKNLVLDPERIDEIERTTKHDVIAFLTHVEELAGADARWLHRGMTSSDVLDTRFAILLRDAADVAARRGSTSCSTRSPQRAREHAKTPMIGRSHGIHAEPITFGVALAGHLAEMTRGRARLARRARRDRGRQDRRRGRHLRAPHAGDRGERARARSGSRAETVATQVVARDRHAAFFAALALVAAGDRAVRHQRAPLAAHRGRRGRGGFTAGQKGSSAMPHKRNPILSENLCGLARVVRAARIPALENVALWHERDISHSSVERMIAPDATTTLAFMLDRARGAGRGARRLPRALAGEPRAHRRAVLQRGGAARARRDRASARQEAYVLVQRNAMKAIEGRGAFRENLESDADIGRVLSAAEIERAFDLEHALRFAKGIVARARR